MSNREIHDWTGWTDKDSSLDLFGNMFRWGISDEKHTDKVMFKAVALTDSFELSANQTMAIDGGTSGGTEGGANPRKAFKARIIGANSPHSFIPDPCDPSFADDLDYVFKLITMHTTFLNGSTTRDVPVTRGDLVSVRLDRSNQAYNLEYGSFEELLAIEDPSGVKGEHCSSLIDLFGEIVHVPFAGATSTGATGRAATYTGQVPAGAGGWSENDKCGNIAVPKYFRFSKSLAALHPACRGRFELFFQLAEAAGVKATITSVRRSPKHQWVLKKYATCYGAMTPASPCYSQHQYGFAVDVVFTYNGKKCMNRNGCIPNVLMPIVKANNLKIRQIGDQDYVHWESTDKTDKATYLELRQKCIQHYYKDNTYTASVASSPGNGVKRWPADFADNLDVIGAAGAGETEAVADGKCPAGQKHYEAGESETETWEAGCYADDSTVAVAVADAGEGEGQEGDG